MVQSREGGSPKGEDMRMNRLGYGFGALVFVVLRCALPTAAAVDESGTVVDTDAGRIRGERTGGSSDVFVFKGIPYAAPPVGELRWRPPQPVTPWKGIRNALAFAPGCPQPDIRIVGRVDRRDEDCLYLNVWTPNLDRDKKLPVMFWIHGGGMTVGSGAMPFYHGGTLAEGGAVVVTINYRLGPLGFLAHPWLSTESEFGISGNYGLMDQVFALRWVRRNIDRFGGDPENVTIFGESAGSVSVNCLIASPRAKGLFHRAIMQSGTAVSVTQTLAQKEEEGKRLAKIVAAGDLDELRSVPPARLLEAVTPKVGLLAGRGVRYGPCVDDYLLSAPPLAIIEQGAFNRVPVIIGTNADEATLFLGRGTGPRRVAGYRMLVRFFFRDHAGEVLKLFPAEKTEDTRMAFSRLVTVSAFIAPARKLARMLSDAGCRVYLYHFMRVPDRMLKSGMGATHGLEIPYIFGTSARLLSADADRELSAAMQVYWLNFARTGRPSGAGLAAWPQYGADGYRWLVLDDDITTAEKLYEKECDLMDRVGAARNGNLQRSGISR